MTAGEALSLAGRVALVTGASRGLGRALALAFGAAGATVACAARSVDQVEDTAARVREAGGQARAFPLDVTRGEQIVTAVAAVTQVLGPIDILVNNAGITAEKKTLEVTDDEWEGMLSTN
ncbi:MAG: SDR family NAD(P)-dependent oxidoreductase, partial [candidate division NC10 bacterium]